MKLNNSLSPKQKTQLQKASIILMSLLFMGILATQINQDKEIEGLNNLKAKNSENMGQNELESFSQQKIQESPKVRENLVAENVEVEELEAAEVVNAPTVAKNTKNTKAKVASPKSITKTSSAVAYSSMKMELANYSGKLSWASSFQRNIKNFAIERSIDDKNYTEIGRVKGEGKGEFTQESLYEFEDTSLMFVQMPSVLYRIKQIGINGDQDYSDLIEFDLGLPEGLYASIDVKAGEQVLIHYAATTSASVSYKVLDTFGKSMKQGELEGEYEPKSMVLEASQWEKGTYYLQLDAGKHSFMEAFQLK